MNFLEWLGGFDLDEQILGIHLVTHSHVNSTNLKVIIIVKIRFESSVDKSELNKK
jgi:hypothetical protein